MKRISFELNTNKTLRPCYPCFLIGFCQNKTVAIINNAELSSADFVRAIRNFIAESEVKPTELIDYAANLYRDLKVNITDNQSKIIFLDFAPLEYNDDLEDTGLSNQEKERLRDWCRTMTTAVPKNTNPYVHPNAVERFRVLATILVASFPKQNWPRIIPANDNYAGANDNCPLEKNESFPQSD